MHVYETNLAEQDIDRRLRISPWIRSQPLQILFINVRLVDARHSVVHNNSSVWIKEGRIKSVAKAQDSIGAVIGVFELPHTDEGLVVDLENKYYMCPGLIDCHVHVTATPGVNNLHEAIEAADQLTTLRSAYVLKGMLSRGFTTVRDTGGASAFLAQAIDEGLIPGPRLIQCGKALSQTGGHGDFRSPNVDTSSCCGGSDFLARTCDGVPAVLSSVRDEIRKGAKFIKVMCGGGVASTTDSLESVQFTSEELQAITTVCRNMGNLPSTAHAYSVPAIRHAIDNGITGIEHGNFIDVDTAKLMAEKGIFLTPTLSCYGIMVRPPFENFLPESSKAKNKAVMDAGLKSIQIAEEAGVTVCYGTDLLISMHALQTEEFTVRSKVLPSSKILKHATTNAAKLLRMEGEIGEIIPGAHADLILLKSNPLSDICVLDRHDSELMAVIKGGYIMQSILSELTVDDES